MIKNPKNKIPSEIAKILKNGAVYRCNISYIIILIILFIKKEKNRKDGQMHEKIEEGNSININIF